MRVLVLFARYGTAKYADALPALDRIYRTQAPELVRRTIVVDNALSPEHVQELSSDTLLIGGDNTDREFSGWQRALDTAARELADYNAVHFVSSAFQMLYSDYLGRFTSKIVEVVSARPVCVGHIDYYPYPIRCGTYVSRHWVRTSFWLIRPSELMRLGSLVSADRSAHLFAPDRDWPFDRDGMLSPGYQQLIFDWLTSPRGTGQGTAWHSHIDPRAPGGREEFLEKARTIINEHMLSIRLRAQGTNLVDITALAELLRRRRSLPDRWPGWRNQIALRQIPGHGDIGHADPR